MGRGSGIDKSRQIYIYRKTKTLGMKDRKYRNRAREETKSIFSDENTCELWCRLSPSPIAKGMNSKTLSSSACFSSRILSPA